MKVIDRIRSTQWFWKYRHWWDPDWPKRYLNEESLNSPHRKMLVDSILKYEPLEIAEFGCGPGPNIYLLKQESYFGEVFGTDISTYALDYGSQWFYKNGMVAALMYPELFQWYLNESDEMDRLLFTDAVLIYFNPKQIVNFLSEMRQKAKTLIFCEWHQEECLHSIFDSHWVHNYWELLRNMANVKIRHIPEAYSGGNSKKYGSIIEYVQ